PILRRGLQLLDDESRCVKHRRKPLDLRDRPVLGGDVQCRRLNKVGEGEKVAIGSRRPGYDANRAEVGSRNPFEGPGTLPMSITPELTAYVVENVDDQIVSRRGDVVDGLARSRLHHQLQVALAGEK